MCPDNIQFADLPNSLTELHSNSFEDSWLWTKNETICNPDGDSDIIVIEGTNVNLQEAYKLGLMVTPEGDLHLLADGKVVGMDWRSVPTDKPLWGVAEVHLTKLKLEVQGKCLNIIYKNFIMKFLYSSKVPMGVCSTQ